MKVCVLLRSCDVAEVALLDVSVVPDDHAFGPDPADPDLLHLESPMPTENHGVEVAQPERTGVCGNTKSGYTCMRLPDHGPGHCALVPAVLKDGRDKMAWWFDGEVGVTTRLPTFGEYELMKAAAEREQE